MRATVTNAFKHNFGPGAANLTVPVPAGALCQWHAENQCWYVCPNVLPLYAQHDATYRGVRVDPDNLTKEGA